MTINAAVLGRLMDRTLFSVDRNEAISVVTCYMKYSRGKARKHLNEDNYKAHNRNSQKLLSNSKVSKGVQIDQNMINSRFQGFSRFY